MGSRKPVVFRDGDYWVAMLDHGTWWDSTDYLAWEQALEHALWLGACANG